MGGARKFSLVGMAGAVILLTGCCLFSSAPNADFSWSPADAISRAEITFSDRSTGGDINAWSWDFGDGSSSSSRNPKHIYMNSGTYQVRLTVTDGCGKVGTATKTVNVAVGVSGTWDGHLRDGGVNLELTLRLSHSGETVTGDVRFLGIWVDGSGTFVGNRLRLTFRLPGDPFNIVLTGDYNPHRDALSGT